ncbi:MAG: FecR domain-containing protein [Anaerolineae bacterium]|nr:FecR domain-containing protein [Anaerolineae bacterium]MBN8618311.1 FecR domain-containing protein [Anaerolineae bacterium]
MRWKILVILIGLFTVSISIASAQGELAATLEVLTDGVEVQRVNTTNWIAVKVEAIVGVGDVIRTDASGRARITFFSDGVDTELLPETEYRITRFEGDEQSFRIGAEVVVGETLQRIGRLLDSSSSYDITTPSMALAARGTVFTIRVGDDGVAKMLVSEGNVEASDEANNASVPPTYGIRGEPGEALSEVVQASSFDQLDSALDGCSASVNITDDVSLNVRLGASLEFERIATIDPQTIDRFMGSTSNGWYRIQFRGGYGWINPSLSSVDPTCPGLRQFTDGYGPEDISQYESLGNPLSASEMPTQPAAEATTSP